FAMNLITAGHYGLVLDTEDKSRKSISSNLDRLPRSPAHCGHFILLNRYKIDDDGHICLTPSLSLYELYGAADTFAAELHSLLEQAKQRFPGGASPTETAILSAILQTPS